jgi:hypothetical protein
MAAESILDIRESDPVWADWGTTWSQSPAVEVAPSATLGDLQEAVRTKFEAARII